MHIPSLHAPLPPSPVTRTRTASLLPPPLCHNQTNTSHRLPHLPPPPPPPPPGSEGGGTRKSAVEQCDAMSTAFNALLTITSPLPSPPLPNLLNPLKKARHGGGIIVFSSSSSSFLNPLRRQFDSAVDEVGFACFGGNLTEWLEFPNELSCTVVYADNACKVENYTKWWHGESGLRHQLNLTAACNSVCRVRDYNNRFGDWFSCPQASDYNPVCWESSSSPLPGNGDAKIQMSFLNPCLAGCASQGFHTEPDGKVVEIYTDCNCVTNTSLVPEGVHSLGGSALRGTTKKGVCRPQCLRYAPFLIVTFLTIFLTSVNQNPSNVITLRISSHELFMLAVSCVAPEDGTAALGLQVFFSRTLAFIPTPIYFGALMDRTCRVRALPQRVICESQQHHLLLLSAMKLAPLEGACLEYDVHALPFAWLGGVTVFKCLSILIAILTWRYSW
ncbi:unnamed protein product [Hydatigera taeniaeformis]|uniref:GPS domain-containing protein n=1 Tax=Hydatigena taeniaeformis TaxID=6205 RepID=A0A0R3XAK4_HYDTA|nr:unnamed protein product [Hydatigera taeniaeformis]